MDQILTISGMHCDACRNLIRMELADNGYADKIKSIKVVGSNQGKIELQETSIAEQAAIKK